MFIVFQTGEKITSLSLSDELLKSMLYNFNVYIEFVLSCICDFDQTFMSNKNNHGYFGATE